MEQAQALDTELVKAAGQIRVLEHLSSPFEAEQTFLSGSRIAQRGATGRENTNASETPTGPAFFNRAID